MRLNALLATSVMFGINGLVSADEATTALPQGSWHVMVCVITDSLGNRCAHLDQDLNLRINLFVGSSAEVIFDGKAPPEVAKQVLDDALSVIDSFGTTQRALVPHGPNAAIDVTLNGRSASVRFSQLSGLEQLGPEMVDLIDLLHRTTHAF